MYLFFFHFVRKRTNTGQIVIRLYINRVTTTINEHSNVNDRKNKPKRKIDNNFKFITNNIFVRRNNVKRLLRF